MDGYVWNIQSTPKKNDQVCNRYGIMKNDLFVMSYYLLQHEKSKRKQRKMGHNSKN